MRINQLITPTPPSAPSTSTRSGSESATHTHTHTEGVDSEAASLLLHFTRGEANESAGEASSSSSRSKGLGFDGRRGGSPLRPLPFPIEGVVSGRGDDRLLQLPSRSTGPAIVEDGASTTAVTWTGPARNRTRSGGTYSSTPIPLTTNLIKARSVSYKDKDKFPSDTSTSTSTSSSVGNLVAFKGNNNNNSKSSGGGGGGIPPSPHLALAPTPSPLPYNDNSRTFKAPLGLPGPLLQVHPPQGPSDLEEHTSGSGPRYRLEGSVPVRSSDAGLSYRPDSPSSSSARTQKGSSAAPGSQTQPPTRPPITTRGPSPRAAATRTQIQVPVQTQGTSPSPSRLTLTRTAPNPNPNPNPNHDLGDRPSASSNLIRAEIIEPEPARPTSTSISTSTSTSTTIPASTTTPTTISTDAEQRRVGYLVWKFGRDMQDTDKETVSRMGSSSLDLICFDMLGWTTGACCVGLGAREG